MISINLPIVKKSQHHETLEFKNINTFKDLAKCIKELDLGLYNEFFDRAGKLDKGYFCALNGNFIEQDSTEKLLFKEGDIVDIYALLSGG